MLHNTLVVGTGLDKLYSQVEEEVPDHKLKNKNKIEIQPVQLKNENILYEMKIFVNDITRFIMEYTYFMKKVRFYKTFDN